MYPEATECPTCGLSRHNTNGKPWRTFFYIPILHRIALWHTSAEYVAEMRAYKAKFSHALDPESFQNREYTEDYWDSWLCHSLREKRGMWRDPRDIGVSLMTDGLSLFKIGSHETWPIAIVNNNLPPAQRIKKHRIILAGCIPGPKSPGDIDSFLHPLFQELKQLEKGIKVLDLDRMAEDAARGFDSSRAEPNRYFTLRGGLTYIIADGMAQAKLMKWVGPNAYNFCRFCGMYGVYCTHIYCPHSLPDDELPIQHAELPPKDWDIDHILVRSDAGIRAAMLEADATITAKGRDDAARVSGFKGETGFCDLKSVIFPWSFTPGIMHLTHKNVTQLYLDRWIPPSEKRKKKKKMTPRQRQQEADKKKKELDRKARERVRIEAAKARNRAARSQGDGTQTQTQFSAAGSRVSDAMWRHSRVGFVDDSDDDDDGENGPPGSDDSDLTYDDQYAAPEDDAEADGGDDEDDEDRDGRVPDTVPDTAPEPPEEPTPPPPYQLTVDAWRALGVDMSASSPSIPGAFGKAIRNIAQYKASFKTSELKNWLLLISPVVLNGRLEGEAYEHWRYVSLFFPVSV